MRVEWEPVDGAEGYFVRFGVVKDALYTHFQIIGDTIANIRCLIKGERYYVTVDAYNAGGVTKGTEVKTV